jgi:hypothetical protein
VVHRASSSHWARVARRPRVAVIRSR